MAEVKDLKAKMTNLQRKVARFLVTSLVIGLCIGTPIALVLSIVETYKVANADMNSVEPYCAARYREDVKAYKACTKLHAHAILQDLTDEINAAAEKELKD